jgi:hypothetical protein
MVIQPPDAVAATFGLLDAQNLHLRDDGTDRCPKIDAVIRDEL